MTTRPVEVSVICAVLNGEAFLTEAIESVRAQTFPDWELLIVNDGSKDGTAQLIAEFEQRDSRIRGLTHPGGVNKGLSPSRNMGILEARGAYIAFIDADDVWRADKLADQVAILRAEPNAGLVCGAVNYWASWSGGSDTIRFTGPDEGLTAAPDMAIKTYPLGKAHAPTPSDIMVRRSVVEAVRGFEDSFVGNLTLYEDQAFLAKAYLQTAVWISGKTWLDYRQHENSVVQSVVRDGQYRAVRRHFLKWYRAMLTKRGEAIHPDLDAALRRAERYESSAILRIANRITRKFRAVVGAVG